MPPPMGLSHLHEPPLAQLLQQGTYPTGLAHLPTGKSVSDGKTVPPGTVIFTGLQALPPVYFSSTGLISSR